MERYHILKLGLAITFYAAYCVRPMLVYSLEAANELDNNPSVLNTDHEYFQYFQGVEGRPGLDFPVYSYIPKTAFNCRGIESGYYADPATDCQIFHICEEGRKISFLCPNGTIFQQSELICEWWNKVNCTNSPNLYQESAERLQNDVARRKASRRVVSNGANANHGAVMRMEERSSVRASSNGRDYPIRQEKQRQQRINNHRIPDNNDIEQQIEQAESNNRHLANAQNNRQSPQRNNFENQQQKYSNHNYNTFDQGAVNSQPTRSKQSKKDIDRDTGNYINNNYDQSATRRTKKIEQGVRNSFDVGSKTGQEKSSTLKEYHVQFGSTSAGAVSATEKYSSVQNDLTPTTQNFQRRGSSSSGFKQYQSNDFSRSSSKSTHAYSTEPMPSQSSFEESYNNDRFGVKTASKLPKASNNNNIFYTTGETKSTIVALSSTLAPLAQKTTEEYAYGTGIKSKYSSFDARQPQKPEAFVKFNQNNLRGTVKYSANSNYLNLQQAKGQGSKKFSTLVTTYSPPIKFSTLRALDNNKEVNKDDNFELPPFPKHKSDLPQSSTNDVQDLPYGNGIANQPISSTGAQTNSPGQNQINVIQPNQKPTKSQDSGETQIPLESSSFVKNSFNSITDDSFKALSSPYPNHRSTYSDIKEISYLEAPKISSISSITPHLVTTQPINNGKPFVGSRVGNTVLPNQPTTQSKYTYLPTSTASSKPTLIFGVIRHSSTTEPPPYGPPEPIKTSNANKGITDLFNTGSTAKTLPPINTSTPVTNAVPTEIFNIGNTDTTIESNVLPSILPTTPPPLKIYVPEQGSLNVGQSDTNANNNYEGLEPVYEPPFIKKTVPLLYSDDNSTERTVDHATVYGTYPSSTQRAFASSRNTPYSPTVPTVTPSLPVGGYSTSSRTPKAFNQGVPVKFDKGQDKISINLSKNVGGQTRTPDLPKYGSAVQPPLLRVGAIVHVGDVQPLRGSSSSTFAPEIQPSGVFVPRDGTQQSFSGAPSKSITEKPRPFSKSFEFKPRLNTANTNNDGQNSIPPAFPSYPISSARPFGISETTSPTPTITTQAPSSFSVYDNVDNMIGVLQEIANFNSHKEFTDDSRPGLVIPPSVGPETLHSLAQYFANELQSNKTSNETLQPDTKEKLTTLLTAMTVHGYNNLFNVGSTTTPAATTTSETTTVVAPSRFGSEETNTISGENQSTGDDGELLSTTSLPELRQLARNFSLALSSYLNDPDNFRNSLERLRPTEPPPLDGSDNVESSTSEDELLNFSDADIKPSTPATPSATWGYILAGDFNKGTQEEVKNSLNPDLNTADSQSFVPRFNNVQVSEKEEKGYTDLPPNHWTSSPQATRLWQKELSVNPAVVNDHFDTTPFSISLTDDEISEPELFNQDVLPDLSGPQSEISYDLRELPPLALNSTQVRGILIDFMNHTKSDEHNRLNRILKKLNTSEEEFLNRMKEIDSNPLTKRLILLLISECGANITEDLGIFANNHHLDTLSESNESLSGSASAPTAAASSHIEERNVENHALRQLVHPHLSEEDQDTRALQLLNSLYNIASRFGKKR